MARHADLRPLILHVVHRFAVGGMENGIVNLVNRLPENRWRHGIVALTAVCPEFSRRIERTDILYASLDKPPGHLAGLYPRLYRMFREHRPAIVHTRNLAALEAAVPAWAAGVPYRVHGEHGWDTHDLDGSSRKYRWMRRLYRPFVDRYIALSQDLERYLTQQVRVRPDRVAQIYNGVDTDRFRSSAAGRLPVPGCPFSDPGLWLVGTVGRMQEVKDQTRLARAFVRALERCPGAERTLRLVMVGDGPLLEPARRLLEQAGAGHLAWLPGERPDVADILRGLDCFVLPSLAEGVSNTILEAMASALPVVATRVGGNAELVLDHMTGRLVPQADSEALATRILDYFQHPETARRHGKAGRCRAQREFSLERMVAGYLELYDSLVSRSRHRATDGAAAGHPGAVR